MASAQQSSQLVQQRRPPPWRNVTVLRWILQIAVLAITIGLFWFLAVVARSNLAAKGFTVSYDFLSDPANIQLGEGIDQTPDTAGRALWVGMVNTLRTSIIGIIAATILGVIVGLARLSTNWMANKAASAYVEGLRNIPVLVQIIFWLTVFNTLPQLVNNSSEVELAAITAAVDDGVSGEEGTELAARLTQLAAPQDQAAAGTGFIREAAAALADGNVELASEALASVEVTPPSGPIPGWLYISNKGVSIPRVFISDGFYQWLALMIPFGLIAWFVYRNRVKKRELEGGETHAGLIGLGVAFVLAVIAWFLNPVMAFLGPVFQAISDAWGSVPQVVVQVLLTVVAVGASLNWIRRFLNSRRSPAGMAKLTDDDYFRMLFSLLGAAMAALVLWVIWPGLSSWIINSGSDLFQVIADKFGDGRSNTVIDAARPSVTEGRFSNYDVGGATLTNFHAALLVGLVLYTASFIAEIVRGGVLAVAKGQSEAAAALGLSRIQSLRKVVLPQAFRVIMPPLGNQYLNITKNTSLGIAVLYSEVVQVGQSIFNKNNQVLAVFSIWMAFYLACSLTISFVVNWINGRLAIVER